MSAGCQGHITGAQCLHPRGCPIFAFHQTGQHACVPTAGLPARSVLFNFLGRDFFNALSEKDADAFSMQLVRYLGAFVVGIPVFVFRDYFQVCHGQGIGGGLACWDATGQCQRGRSQTRAPPGRRAERVGLMQRLTAQLP